MMPEIRIQCEGVKTFVQHEKLSIFQGDLKTLSEAALSKLKSRILKVGFKYPLFVWKRADRLWILDGTERLLAVRALEADGHTVPPLPVVFIEAANKKEAKEEVLHLSSTFGRITKKGLVDFLGESRLDLGTISLNDISLDVTSLLDPNYGVDQERHEKIKPYRFMRVLLSFPPSAYRKIRSQLAQIEKTTGVEVDRSWS